MLFRRVSSVGLGLCLLVGLGGALAQDIPTPISTPNAISIPIPSANALTDPQTGADYSIQSYLPANFPVGMVFAPDGTLFYNEKTTGAVRRVSPAGKLDPQPIAQFNISALQERGMLGLALAPDFETSRLMYVGYTQAGDARNYPANTLTRFRLDEDNRAQDLQVLLSAPIITGELLHNGGNVHFSPDGYLFFSLGDFGDASQSQDTNSIQGKMLRYSVTVDGIVPAQGNPFGDDNPVWAYGFRNPFDFTFDPLTGNLFVAEVGPDCDDELNLVLPAFNYGWRENYECVGTQVIPNLMLYAPPLLSFNPVEAPTGLIIYDGDAFPEWQGDLLWCNWNFGDLRRAELDDARTRITAVYDIPLGGVKCRIDLVQGLDGALYFGTVGDFGGAIMRLAPRE
jgi:glucose/arabinose dehydrogenase